MERARRAGLALGLIWLGHGLGAFLWPARLVKANGNPDLTLDLAAELGVLAQELLCRLPALAQALLAVGVPGPGLPDDAALDAEVQDGALLGDARTVHDVELSGLERRRHLVLDDLDAHAIANDVAVNLDGVDAPNVKAHGGEELERATPRRGLGVAKHDTDLLAKLVDEDAGGV